jgi:hypothetical protein
MAAGSISFGTLSVRCISGVTNTREAFCGGVPLRGGSGCRIPLPPEGAASRLGAKIRTISDGFGTTSGLIDHMSRKTMNNT